jgi:hypothetical protein
MKEDFGPRKKRKAKERDGEEAVSDNTWAPCATADSIVYLLTYNSTACRIAPTPPPKKTTNPKINTKNKARDSLPFLCDINPGGSLGVQESRISGMRAIPRMEYHISQTTLDPLVGKV